MLDTLTQNDCAPQSTVEAHLRVDIRVCDGMDVQPSKSLQPTVIPLRGLPAAQLKRYLALDR